jgi:hypothetical protein
VVKCGRFLGAGAYRCRFRFGPRGKWKTLTRMKWPYNALSQIPGSSQNLTQKGVASRRDVIATKAPTPGAVISREGHALATAEFNTIRLRLLKLGARVLETASRVRLAFAAACPDATLVRYIATALMPAGP